MDLFLAAEQNPGMRLSRGLWDQPALDIMGIRAGRKAAEGGEDTGGENQSRRDSRVGADNGERTIW